MCLQILQSAIKRNFLIQNIVTCVMFLYSVTLPKLLTNIKVTACVHWGVPGSRIRARSSDYCAE